MLRSVSSVTDVFMHFQTGSEESKIIFNFESPSWNQIHEYILESNISP